MKSIGAFDKSSCRTPQQTFLVVPYRAWQESRRQPSGIKVIPLAQISKQIARFGVKEYFLLVNGIIRLIKAFSK